MRKEAFLEQLKKDADEVEEHVQQGMAAASLLIAEDYDWDPAAVVLALGEYALALIAIHKQIVLFHDFLSGR